MNLRSIFLQAGLLTVGVALSAAGFQGTGGDPVRPFQDHASPERGFIYEDLRVNVPLPRPGSKQFVYNPDIIELIEQVDEATVLAYLEGLVSFGPRVTGTPACDNAADYIYDSFASMGLDVRYDPWSYGGYSADNVEATLWGEDPTSDEIYIVCGHYDTVSGSPGADDNASGTVAAIVAAHVMSQYAFNHTVRFVGFSGEEEGLLGSHEYVEEAFGNGDNIVAALNADMISFAVTDYDRTHVKIYHDTPSYWLVTFTDNVASDYFDYINLDIIPSGSSGGSDHASFWEFGYDAIFYHEYNFSDYYHSPQDVIENTDRIYHTRVCRLILATLAELAELAPLGHIEGYVTDAASGDPLSADVRVLGTLKETTTDPSGYYSLSVWDDSSYVVAASAYGYRSLEQGVYVPPDGTVQLDFALEQAEFGTIEGTVRSALDGQPLSGVEVTVLETPLPPEYTDENGHFSFDIPGSATYQVQAVLATFIGDTKTVTVQENETTLVSFALGKAESFEGDDGGWVGLMLWEWGTPSSYGPGGAHWGEKCWATNLDGPYGNNANSPLTTIEYDLSEATSGTLNFYHYYDTQDGRDGGNVKISTDGGATWELLAPQGGYPVPSMYWNDEAGYSGASAGWELATFDLADYLGEQVLFRFRFGSDGSGNGPGWYIDDAYLELAYPVSIVLIPDSETVPRGTPLGLTVDGQNAADHAITLLVWSEVILPDGSAYPGNPVFGPYTVMLPAQSNPSAHISHMVPRAAPLGTYTYIMKIGLSQETVYARDFFDVTVTP